MLQVIEFYDHNDEGVPSRFRVVCDVEGLDRDVMNMICSRGDRVPWSNWSYGAFLPVEQDKLFLGEEVLKLLSVKHRALMRKQG
jgi:hypothetical protein